MVNLTQWGCLKLHLRGTQINAGGGHVRIEVQANANQLLWFLYSILGKNDYAGARTFNIGIADALTSTNNNLAWLARNVTIDNKQIGFPPLGQTIANDGELPMDVRHWIIFPADVLYMQINSLAENEVADWHIRLLSNGGELPTIDYSNGTGTVTGATQTSEYEGNIDL